MVTCDDCKEAIFDRQESVIAEPVCMPTCPEDVGCTDTIATTCIYIPYALSCLGTDAGASLDAFIAAVESLVCTAGGGGNACKVKTDADDPCCQYLEDKLYSESLDITTNGLRSCHRIEIEEKPWIFASLTPQNKWTNRGGSYTNLSYGIKNDEVTMRGQVYYASNAGGSQITSTLCTLPAAAWPNERKVFSYTAPNNNGVLMINAVITIETTGVVSILTTAILGSTPEYATLSLDHCKWTN